MQLKPLMLSVSAALAIPTFAAAPVDYAKKMTLTVDPVKAGFEATSVADMPVAVRLSTAIPGFSYADFKSEGADKDLLFTDVGGNPLPFEIEKWNPEGESIVWVKLPRFAAGERIYLYYGGEAVSQNAEGVWGAYGGVWHMAEASGDVADSSGHGRTAVPGGDSKDQNVGTDGVIGGARVNCQTGTAWLQAQNSTNLGYGDTFTVSGWFKLDTKNPDGQPTLITTKQRRWDGQGWGIRLQKDSEGDVLLRGRGDAGWATLVAQNVPIKDNWVHLAVAYGSGDKGVLYVNGVRATTLRSDEMTATGWLQSASDSEYPLTFGHNANNVWDDGWSRPFWGSYDEIRISDGTMDDARAKAEYLSQTGEVLTMAVADNGSEAYKPVVLTNFSKQFTIRAGYAGEATYADFPMLVRLSEAIEGFKYADFIQQDYSDLAFFDQNGNSLAFDVDTWNVEGESLVWVKVPQFSSATVLTVAYGGLAQNDIHQAATWSKYRGVWHMNETGDGAQAIHDATASAMNGVSHTATSYKADGQFGGSRTMAKNRGNSDQNGGVRIPFNPAMNIDGKDKFHLIASSWVKLSSGGNWGGALFSRKNDMADGGWGMAYHMAAMNHYDFYYRESYEGIYTPWSSDAGGYTQYNSAESIWKSTADTENWHKVTFDYYWDGGIIHANVYLDGEKGGECWLFNMAADSEGNSTGERSYAPIYQPTDRGLAFGAFLGSGQHPLLGAMDEIRLRTGDISPDREALEFAQESNATYHTASAVTTVEGSDVPGHVTLAKPITVNRQDGEGVVTLTVSGDVLALAGGASAELKLLLAETEQKDGDAYELVEVATKTVTEAGAFSFTWSDAKLGTKVRCQVVSDMTIDATHTLTVATDEAAILLEDPMKFAWIDGKEGLWSDAANWRAESTDGMPRIGYPTWGSTYHFANVHAVAEVDAAYEGLVGDNTLGWSNSDITLKGVVDGASLNACNSVGVRDGTAYLRLDGVRILQRIGNINLKTGSVLELNDGAMLETSWELTAEAEGSRIYVGTNATLNVSMAEPYHRLGLARNGQIVVDGGTINTQHFLIGHDGRAVDGAQLVLKGASPQLQVRGEAKVSGTTSADATVCFVLPEDGFARTPILKAGSNGLAFMDNGDSAQKVSFVIDRASPFYDQDKAELSQLLVDWTRNGSAYAIDTEAIALVSPRGANPGFRYDPATGETKSKLFVDLKKALGLAVTVR